MNFNFYNPVQIEFGIEYLEEISKIKSQNILLVTSDGFQKRGIVDKIKGILNHKLKKVLHHIAPNPQIQFFNTLEGATDSIDCIIALGGGSVIDCAKALSIARSLQIQNNLLIPKPNKSPIDVFAFPTTAGTSSELTPWATIWDKKDQKKYSLHHENLYCKKAFYDSHLMLTLPRDITIATSLDALSHCIESIWNKNANPISTNNALKGIQLILENLPKLLDNPDSLYLREQISLASIFAGLAFCATQTALAHAISYPITMQKNIPHGIACSFSIPFLLDNLPEGNPKNILSPYQKDIKNLFEQLHVKTDFKDYGITPKDIEDIFHSLNSRAKNSIFDLEAIQNKLIK
ncbi:phosphonoacetaldehyde reductase [Helicobacter sp. 11S03491-1]|uniref:phosphonoacetaldehyde reductase n=1 Tax=Helicobacter sp. 11S03491-1 TaxID=1476196 RepID=UPI000BA68CEC|nr:phosphonoacetaldehyde reductase [Helicobacter sp. 11S03491-1]PAF43788.1 hypothetical protein BKH45_00540 [Helicobacter sp. 11S03491-1]